MTNKQLREMIRSIIAEEINNQRIDEDIAGWLGGVGRKIAFDIIDRRAKGIKSTLKMDPKLQRLAKDLRLTTADLEQRINTLIDRDPKFLRALATQRAARW